MQLTRSAALLLIPALILLLLLLVLPLVLTAEESFRQFVPGRVGSALDAPLTLANYTELLKPAYVGYFIETFRIGLVATIIGLIIAYPIAYSIARQKSAVLRKLWVAFLIAMMFLSALVRVYSLALTFGPVGYLRVLARLFGLNPNGPTMTETLVIAGLLHYIVPMSSLVLVGTIQNVNPRLADAAQALGAARWRAHLDVTLPLSIRGLISAFLIAYTLCISAFVIPMILGKGSILFVSNLIYSRFSEVSNKPSGAAISMVMVVLSLALIYAVTRMGTVYERR
jgi:putative spermidine/putrescine transport system permease protein